MQVGINKRVIDLPWLEQQRSQHLVVLYDGFLATNQVQSPRV